MSKKINESPKWSKVVGMPDSWDKKNIQALVNTFCETSFDIPITDEPNGPKVTLTGAEWIKTTVKEARKRHQLELGNDFGEKSKAMELRVLTSVPRPLFMKLKEGYPTLFSDTEQHIWFARNFPIFRLPKRL